MKSVSPAGGALIFPPSKSIIFTKRKENEANRSANQLPYDVINPLATIYWYYLGVEIKWLKKKPKEELLWSCANYEKQ